MCPISIDFFHNKIYLRFAHLHYILEILSEQQMVAIFKPRFSKSLFSRFNFLQQWHTPAPRGAALLFSPMKQVVCVCVCVFSSLQHLQLSQQETVIRLQLWSCAYK